MAISDLHLFIDFYLEEPVFSKKPLETLQILIKECLPAWSSSLKVALYENDEDAIFIEKNSLFEVMQKTKLTHQNFASIVIEGDYEEILFILLGSKSTLPPESNLIEIQIYGVSQIEEMSIFDWTQNFFKKITSIIPIRYGKAYLEEEFESKNMIINDEEREAIGVNLNNAVPGIYWLNFFGKPYEVMFKGKHEYLTPLVYEAYENEQGLLLILDKTALNWQDNDYKQKENEITSILGKNYFFSRSELDRVTIAPNFHSAQI